MQAMVLALRVALEVELHPGRAPVPLPVGMGGPGLPPDEDGAGTGLHAEWLLTSLMHSGPPHVARRVCMESTELMQTSGFRISYERSLRR